LRSSAVGRGGASRGFAKLRIRPPRDGTRAGRGALSRRPGGTLIWMNGIVIAGVLALIFRTFFA
jgi:hypothetical protein